MRKKLVAFDFDGVVHEFAHWRPQPFGRVDFGGIKLAHSQGWAVAIMTCNEVADVARAVRAAGFKAVTDAGGWHLYWDGGADGRKILVTNRKVAAQAYVDDRAVCHRWGDSWEDTLAQAQAVAEAARVMA